jgi:hypothetical protein
VRRGYGFRARGPLSLIDVPDRLSPQPNVSYPPGTLRSMDITEIIHGTPTEIERLFADLGLAVTEVARCPEPACPVCGPIDLGRAA